MTENAQLAASTLANLVALGVKKVVVCAGARNAPIVASLLSVRERAGFEVFHHFDERSASFFALGLAKRDWQPVAVITTSGTAVAELLPAAVEGYYSGIPLVLVTADRPIRYRGSGAPQAIEQKELFGPYTPISLDLERVWDPDDLGDWDGASPVHLNVCLEEPRPDDVVTELPESVFSPPRTGEIKSVGDRLTDFLQDGNNGVVVLLGELAPSWRAGVESFLVKLGAPVWAECTSGLRESVALGNLLVPFEQNVSQFDIRKVVRIGGVPSLRFWRDLEDARDIRVLSISRRPFSGLSRDSELIVTDEFPEVACSTHEILDERIDDSEGDRFEQLLEKYSASEAALVRKLGASIPSEALVFLGNSLPVREWNLSAPYGRPHPRCFASRGANGIDGQVSTFLGLSHGEEESWGIFGDLTTLYDLNAPALLEQTGEGKRRIVVINNGGGRIFSRLPSLSKLPESHKEVTENRHERHLEDWAKMWGMEYVSWTGTEDFLLSDSKRIVLELLPDIDATESFWSEWK